MPGYVISGIVKELGTPVERTVRAHLRSTGAVADEVASDPDGTYVLAVDTNGEHYVVALDDASGESYNALIWDGVVPGAIDGGYDYATFLSGKSGDAWLPAPVGHYQDSGRTTGARVDDPVGSATGEGAQFNANQSTAGSRPTLRRSGSKYWFEGDGGDYLTAGANSSWNFLHNGSGNAYVCLAIRLGAAADPDTSYAIADTCGASSSNTGCAIWWSDISGSGHNEKMRLLIGKGSVGNPAIDVGAPNDLVDAQTDVVLEFVKSGQNVAIYANGVMVLSGTLASPASGNATSALHLMAFTTPASQLVGRLYGMLVCNAVPTAAQRADIQADMAARCVAPPSIAPESPVNYPALLRTRIGDAWLPAGSGHYQDAARTSAAAADDPIGSATGEAAQFHASQASAGAKPTLRAASGKHYFEGDGGDYLVAGAVGDWKWMHNATGNAYACLAVSIGAAADPNDAYTLLDTCGGTSANIGATQFWDDRVSVSRNEMERLIVGRGVSGAPAIDTGSSNGAVPPQTDVVLEYVKIATAVTVYLNGTQLFTGTLSNASASDSTGALTMLANIAGAGGLVGRLYGLVVYDAVPNSLARRAVQEDMAARCVSPPTISG